MRNLHTTSRGAAQRWTEMLAEAAAQRLAAEAQGTRAGRARRVWGFTGGGHGVTYRTSPTLGPDAASMTRPRLA